MEAQPGVPAPGITADLLELQAENAKLRVDLEAARTAHDATCRVAAGMELQVSALRKKLELLKTQEPFVAEALRLTCLTPGTPEFNRTLAAFRKAHDEYAANQNDWKKNTHPPGCQCEDDIHKILPGITCSVCGSPAPPYDRCPQCGSAGIPRG